MRILAEDTIALVIDYQERLMPVIDGAEKIIERSRILLQGLRALGVPLIVTQQYPKGLGQTVTPITEVLESFVPLDKTAFSCYDDPAIKAAVDASGKKTVLLCGVEAHVCVLQTLIDLQAAGYTVVLVEDCVSSRCAKDKKIALKRAAQEGARSASCESILFELTRRAGGETFKTISKLVK